jgi:membrane protein CcdC involved in cytochrome C biogenesis
MENVWMKLSKSLRKLVTILIGRLIMQRKITDELAMDIIATMFQRPDWGDIFLADIDEIIRQTGRTTEENEGDE